MIRVDTAGRFKKARVMRREMKMDAWSEQHFGVIIDSNQWGVQIYDDKSPWNNGISEQMLWASEWFAWKSKNQKVELA